MRHLHLHDALDPDCEHCQDIYKRSIKPGFLRGIYWRLRSWKFSRSLRPNRNVTTYNSLEDFRRTLSSQCEAGVTKSRVFSELGDDDLIWKNKNVDESRAEE